MRAASWKWIIGIAVGGTVLLVAQEWQTVSNLADVDFTRLSAAKKTSALHALRNFDCSCGCAMKVAECRVKDPNCSYSRGLATALVESIKNGKAEADAVAEVKASKLAQPREFKLLDDPVAIPTLGSPSVGPADARVVLVEFSDFQCPYCVKAIEKINAVLKAYPKDVRLVFKQFPLETHPQASISAAAALAAHNQGKFWQMHDVLFANRAQLSRPNILGWAAKLGLDMKRFQDDLDSETIKNAVIKDTRDGDKAGVEGTPTLFIDGQRYNGDLAMEAIKPVINGELKRLASKK